MTALNIFTYQDTPVRTVQIDNEPWFVLADLAKVLEIRNVGNVASRIDKADIRQADIRSGGQMRAMTIVSESGMYEVVIRSDKPEAVSLRRWITSEVLPSIRKTGSFGATPALTEDEIVRQALQITAQRVEALESKITADAPKVDYVDTFVADDDALSFRTVASSLGITELELRVALLSKGWIYKESATRFSESKGRVVARNRYSEYSHKKPYFLRVENHDAPRFRGEVMHTLKVTPSGAAAIAKHVVK